jgi:hypothetical protein
MPSHDRGVRNCILGSWRRRRNALARKWEQEYDVEILAEAADMLARAGLGVDASPADIASVAARGDQS